MNNMEFDNYFYEEEYKKYLNGKNNNLSSIISFELQKININKIKKTIYSLFNYLTKEQEDYIDKLCSQLQEFKNGLFYKIYNYLEDNNYYDLGNNEQKNILIELNNLRKNSKIKFKQINDNLFIHFENNFQKLIEFIENGKIDNALKQITIIDTIKNEIINSIQELDFIQNHHFSNCSNIIQLQNKTKFSNKKNINKKYNILKIDYNKFKKKRTQTPINLRNPSFQIDSIFNGNNINNKRKQLSYSYIKPVPIHNDISYENNTFYINNSKEEKDKNNLIKEYRNKIKDKNSEIEYLRELLLREKEYKNIIFKEFNNLKYINKNNNGNFQNTMSIMHLNTLSSKVNKLSEMVMNFSNSLRHFHDSVYKNSNNNFEIKNIYQKLIKKLDLIVDLNYETKQIENKMIKQETKVFKLNPSLKNLFAHYNEKTKVKNANISNNISQKLTNEENNNISFRNRNIEIYNGKNLKNSKEKLNKNNNILQKLLNENKNLKSQIASLVLSYDSKNSLKNENDENLKEEIEQLKKDIKEKNIIIEILKNSEGNNQINDIDKNHQNNEINTKRSLNKDELKKEIQFLNYQFESMENVKRIKNIFKNIEDNNLEEENMKLEIENKKLKKEIESNNLINIKKELEEKIEKLNLFIIKNQNEINDLNSTIILLKSNIDKLKQENKILIECNKNYLNKNFKYKITSFNLTINPDLEILMIKTESSIKKEEINILKKKNQELIDVNKSLYEITQELKININNEKNNLITLIKNAFEKFIYETKIDNKNKEFLLVLFKTLDYSDDEINFILSIINGKKKSKMGNFFQVKI